MTHDPRTTEEIYQSLESSLAGKIAKLTNFTDRSFNYVWTQAFSQEIRELEVLAVVSELSGWIDYTGGPVTNDDLESLGISDDISPTDISEFMEDDYLDEYVKIVGIERLPGSRSAGTVTFTTQVSQTDIPEGTRVTTPPDSDGNTIDFVTTETADTSTGATTVSDVSIQAVAVGEEFNVPANTITRLADPPIGVNSVDNPASTTGGEGEESNEDLRARAKQAVQSSSEGGTTDGIKGYIRQNVEGVGAGDVIIDEFTDPCPPFVDVIVDGGLDSDVLDAIDFSRPAGIRHNLIRPQIIQLGVETSLLGTDIDTTGVEDDLETFLLNLGVNENLYQDEFIRQIMESDEDIINVGRLGGTIERVTKETFTYQTGTSDYLLDFTYESTNGSITVEDESGDTYTEGNDFEVQDQTGDSYPETLVWIGATPDDQEDFFVDYDVTVSGSTPTEDEYRLDLIRDEFFTFEEGRTDTFTFDSTQNLYELTYVPFDGSSSITDNSSDTYAEGTDYEIIDDSGNGFAQTIDWSIGGGTPDDNEDFTITYNQKLYQTEYEIVETPGGIIRDASGDLYNQDTEYEIVDYTQDKENDAIHWLTNPASLSNGEEFYFTYLNEGDRFIETREKIDPGTIRATTE